MTTLKYKDAGVWKYLPLGGPSSVPMDPWHVVGSAGEPAFQGAWVNYANGFAPAAFRKDPFGRVHLRGLVRAGTLQTPIFQLPVGYRPAAISGAGTVVDAASASAAMAELRVDVNGVIMLQAGSTGYVPLDGLSFDTDTVTAMPTGPQGPAGPTMVGSAFHFVVNATQNISSAQVITWSGEVVDTDNLRSANITQVVPTAGVWLLGGSVRPDTALSAGVYMQCFIQKNGANISESVAVQQSGATPPSAIMPMTPVIANGTDAFRIMVYTSGGAFPLEIAGGTMFSGVRVGS